MEDDPDDQRFLREALEEGAAADRRSGCPGIDVLCLEALESACDLAFDGAFDAILLSLSLPDSRVPRETFTQLNSVAAGTAILILTGDDDPVLAAHLLREGAQDVLVKEHIDAEPLARSIRNAIERQRFVNAVRFAAAPPPSIDAQLPAAPEAESDDHDDILLSLVHIAAVTARGVDAETVMLAD